MGTFGGIVVKEKFSLSSGLFNFDIDGLSPDTLQQDKALIARMPEVVFCFDSPSGQGLKGAIRINPELMKGDADFKALYPHMEARFLKYGFTIDPACKDIRRLCFVSSDPLIYINYDATVFVPPVIVVPVKPKPLTVQAPSPYHIEDDEKHIKWCVAILTNAKPGGRHSARLKAGRTAGGFITGGLADEANISDALIQASDDVSDGGETSPAEMKTLMDSIERGKTEPLTDNHNADWSIALTSHVEKWNQTHASVIVGGKHRIMRLEPGCASHNGRDFYAFYTRNELSLVHDNALIKTGEKPGRAEVVDILKNELMAWAKDSRSRSYTGGIVFLPGRLAPKNYFNTWEGFSVAPQQNEKLLERIYYHIKEVVCSGHVDLYEYFLNWTASTIQYPDRPAGSALVLRGGKGSGKGVIGRFLKNIWGHHGLHIFNAKHLVGSFNGHFNDICFVFADEAFYSGDKQHESVLKGLITEPTTTIERKGIDAVQQPNYLKVFMATNSDYAVPASRDERRYCVMDVSNVHIGDRDYFSALHGDCESLEAQSAFLYEMQNKDLTGWHSGDIPDSIGLRAQRYHSMDSVQKWIVDALNNGQFGCDITGSWENALSSEKLFIHYMAWCEFGKVSEYRRLNQCQIGKYLGTAFSCKLHVGSRNKRGYTFGTLEQAISSFEMYEKVVLSELVQDT